VRQHIPGKLFEGGKCVGKPLFSHTRTQGKSAGTHAPGAKNSLSS
jgi:hypothetical protein